MVIGNNFVLQPNGDRLSDFQIVLVSFLCMFVSRFSLPTPSSLSSLSTQLLLRFPTEFLIFLTQNCTAALARPCWEMSKSKHWRIRGKYVAQASWSPFLLLSSSCWKCFIHEANPELPNPSLLQTQDSLRFLRQQPAQTILRSDRLLRSIFGESFSVF